MISFPLSDQQCQLPVLAKIFQHYSAMQSNFINEQYRMLYKISMVMKLN